MTIEIKTQRLVWIDLEMTGLDTDQDSIIEIATVVTDSNLNILAEGPVIAIHHAESVLQNMDDWNCRHHTSSGLWQRVLESGHDMHRAETETIKFMQKWVEKGASPMCGNSICQDRRFLHRQMPDLMNWFHYRNLDVSTLKILAGQWMDAEKAVYSKQNLHTALADIHESIAELQYYRQFMGEFGGLQ